MRRTIRVENTSRLCWLVVLACCGGETPAPAAAPIVGGSLPASQEANAAMSSAGSPADVVVTMRATAKIMPLMAASATAPTTMPATSNSATAGAGGDVNAGAGSMSTAGTRGALVAGGGGASGFADGMGAGAPYAVGAGSGAGAGMGAPAPAGGAGGLSPESMAASSDPGGPPPSITGSANFVTTGTDVTFSMTVKGCRPGRAYPVHIYEGTSCENAMTQGGHWDMTRGDGIPNMLCAVGRQGMLLLVRDSTVDLSNAWSIGDGRASDIVGHPLVIHDGDDPSLRIACGVITKN